jgi:dihydroneopterin aldolase
MKNEVYSIIAGDIEIWAKIGVHAEEQLVENQLIVTVEVHSMQPYKKGEYLDYEQILDIVHTVFGHSQKVLEDIAVEIIETIKDRFEAPLSSIACKIKKVKPAVRGMKVGHLGVDITRHF